MRRTSVGIILVIGITGIIASVLASGLLTIYRQIPNSGNVKTIGVGVYWDSDCTNNVTSIDWGTLEPGSTRNKIVYIKNEGDTPIMLNMTTGNWDPSVASNYIHLSWNCEGTILDTNTPVVQAVLTLSVSSSVSGVSGFSFDITIKGTEHS